MREVVLVGAEHGFEQTMTTIFSSRTNQFEVEPPEDFEVATELESGDAVAIEIYAGAIDDKIDHFTASGLCMPNDISSYLSGWHYFTALSQRLRRGGYEVQEVDDKRLVCDVASRAADYSADAAFRSYVRGYPTRRDEHIMNRGRAFINFINAVLKENAIYANLADTTAGVVSMGQAHAVSLAANEELQERCGIKVIKFLSSVVLPLEDHRPFSNSVYKSELIVPTHESIVEEAVAHTIGRELARRKYNAYSIGRVLGRKELDPDFVGMFYVSDSAAESMFELTIVDRNGNDFEGVVNDVLGDATVAGTITDKSIAFKKTYNLATVDPTHNYTPVFYEGAFDDYAGQYKGKWDADPSAVSEGCLFTMRKFTSEAAALLDKYNPSMAS